MFTAYTLEQREEAFWSKVKRSEGCWEWQAAKWPTGYGLSWFNGNNRMAHRVSYELTVGTIPEGLELDHLCRNKVCVNPKHLEPVTHKVNVRRGLICARNSCPHGHMYDEANTVINKAGHKSCRTCRILNYQRNKVKYCDNARRKRHLLRQASLGGSK